jgi:hypothetical protein
MIICVSALACVAFVTNHIMSQMFVSAQAQALVGFWIQWVQVKGKLQLMADCLKLCC